MASRVAVVTPAPPPPWAVDEEPLSRTPVLPRPRLSRGTVHIRVEWCKGCELCVAFCPTRVLQLSSAFNAKGYHFPVVISDDCVVCQACSTICPDFAIFALPSPA